MQEEVSCVKLNYATISKGASMDVDTLKIALSHVFQRIGELIQEQEAMVLDFGFATLGIS